MAAKPKQILDELSHPGPHEVLHGNLALVGLPGVVFTPSAGLNLPAIAFGHGWLQPPTRYRELLRHLASWGIVAAAPATQSGPLPSHRLFASDLRTSLDIVTGVRLGADGISVDPGKLGVAGHSIGGGAAVLAAADKADRPKIRAVATIAAAQTMPPATEAARDVHVPGLHLAAEEDLVAPALGNSEAMTHAWGDEDVQFRTIGKSTHLGVTEGKHWSQLVLHGKPHHRTQRVTRALFTAFFLTHLTRTDAYRPLLEADLKAATLPPAEKHADV
ncbi:alpha/beta hydrolase [Amycolatopsis antarctica]|uniref:Alpha/beta hydrolase n=1 Tax=Amycolatopsis antarctica TaxID=1854586 RepID=A0A263D9T4_9PSEU|nr:alpha/beta hydrolase [Amycolatopsis antarctica]OZM75274.1 alpha/beta hydrolase [Amycolatopsis antarctica]